MDSARETALLARSTAFSRESRTRNVRGLGGGALGEAVLGQPIRQHVRIEGEERTDVGTLVAHDDDVGDEWVGRQGVFEDLR